MDNKTQELIRKKEQLMRWYQEGLIDTEEVESKLRCIQQELESKKE